jgi:glycosyltransferase involved in cell wall biosynthesis
VSIVIPARNEAANIGDLIEGISRVCMPICSHEIIVVDDAATDGMAEIVRARMQTIPGLRLLTHQSSAGQSAAVETGVRAALSDVVVTLDGDGQNPPEDLPKLFLPLLEGGTGLMAGQRIGRQDTLSKRVASRVANRIRSAALGDGTRDTGCGLKAFRREDYLRLPYFDHMHRFLPALFAREGLRVTHVDVGHRPRAGGRSHYSNLQRAMVGIVDLIGVMWLIRRSRHGTLVQPVTDTPPDPYEAREN